MGVRRALLLLLAAALFAPAAHVWGRTGHAYIDTVQFRRGTRSDLLVSFRVQRAFDDRVVDTLDAGLPVRFTYQLRVLRSRDVLSDVVVKDVHFDRTLVKDNLKDRYRVEPERGRQGQDVASLAEAVEAMTRVEGVRLLPLDALGRSGPLVLKIKAKLQKFQLPFHLHYLFAFVSYWDVETDWYVVELPANADAVP
ncbi:MAG: DUF4390 domain-containing protein [Deltaproteobacteria bacterium]|nr:DUF4390 domain-containing protein [Deltaproteobacteria bacterium]